MNISKLLWKKISSNSREFEQSLEKNKRKQTGSYYTSLELTDAMMDELVCSLPNSAKASIEMLRFLEPCVGTGNFVFSYIKACIKYIHTSEAFQTMLNNIYVCDINQNALDVYKNNLSIVANELYNINLSDNYFAEHIGGGLLFDVEAENTSFVSLVDVFGENVGKFDIIATNPPYKNLKAEVSHYVSDLDKMIDKQKYAKISKLANSHLYYSTTGTLNLYKLFVEEILENYLADKGFCSLLIPSSILSDKTCERLRGRILDSYVLLSVKTLSEKNTYVDAKQALCNMLLCKGEKTNFIRISKNYSLDNLNEVIVSIDDLLSSVDGNSITVLSESEYKKLGSLNSHPKIKEISYIHNLRGELDLTQNKEYISQSSTDYKLIRGRHIGLFNLIEATQKEYVTHEFVAKCSKRDYILQNRIACKQISNQCQEKRVTFAPVEPGIILGNSCNFISVDKNDDSVDLLWLLGVLNSSLINWYFKLTSSNNHINNYEIDNFPLPIKSKNKNDIRKLVVEYISNGNADLLRQIDLLVNQAYGIKEIYNQTANNMLIFSKDALSQDFYNDIKQILPNISFDISDKILSGNTTIHEVILKEKILLSSFEKNVLLGIVNKYLALSNGQVLNHTSFKLSDLDIEMIKNIPQGGSWKDIPAETVAKSQRLTRITQTGGRTTLYGRIDYAKPSYTITTYFNRPGNGTYVHPIHDRVLSVREAARFQSFPDNYYFWGNKTQLLKQVGNAVPTLMAYQIAKKIVIETGCTHSLDLFCGAGGMTKGFKLGGIRSMISTDIEESACITLKINNPEIPVICGDITDDKIKKALTDVALSNGVDIICGGPPCQGFSMAGFRMKDDPRNKLFQDFADTVSIVKPKVIVFENVEGLLTLEKGKTYRNILQLFSELGYNAKGKTLYSHHYGVPQKRKRVILICTRKELEIDPEKLFPTPCTSDENSHVTAKDTLFDLENVECSETAKYLDFKESDYVKWLKSKISVDQFISKISTQKSRDIQYKPLQLTLF